MPNQSLIRNVKELPYGRTGVPFDATSTHRNYLRRFRVMVNSPLAGPVTVCFAGDIPRPFSPYSTDGESDLLALCIGIDANQEHDNDWQSWIVNCKYSTDVPLTGPYDFLSPDGQGGDQNNPEHEPPEISWDWEIEQRALAKDLDGKPIVNSATQTFTPAVTFEIGHAILNYTRNEVFFDAKRANKFCYVTNSDVFLGCPPGTVLCYPPRASRVFKGKMNYWKVHYKFRFGRQLEDGTFETIQPVLLDQGMCRLVNGKEKQFVKVVGGGALGALLGAGANVPILEPVPILGRGGIPITQPVMLDGKGQPARGKWVKVQVPVPIGPGGALLMVDQELKFTPEPVYLPFRIYRKEKLNKILTVIP